MKAKYKQTAMSTDERKAFITEAKGLMGDDLEILVHQTINKQKDLLERMVTVGGVRLA